jgi:hypothetical protein
LLIWYILLFVIGVQERASIKMVILSQKMTHLSVDPSVSMKPPLMPPFWLSHISTTHWNVFSICWITLNYNLFETYNLFHPKNGILLSLSKVGCFKVMKFGVSTWEPLKVIENCVGLCIFQGFNGSIVGQSWHHGFATIVKMTTCSIFG